MTITDVDAAEADSTAVGRLQHPWLVGTTVCAVVVTAIRWLTSLGRDEYAIWPDEPAQLAIARYVGGGTRWYMHNHSIWRPMFGTLLAPAHWFTDDPTTIFHVALALNAVLGGIAAALLVVLTRRLTGFGPWICVAIAGIVSLSPAVLFTTDFVYSESLLLPLYLAVVLLLSAFHERPAVLTGVAAGVASGLAFGTHSRMLPLALLTISAAVLAGWRRRLGWGGVALVAASAAVTVAAMSAYTDFLVGRLWNEPSTRNSPEGVLGQLDTGTALLVSLVGQTWTLLVASLGIVGYGAVALARRAVGRGKDHDRLVGDARVVLAIAGACIALSVLFMADRWRSDQLVYGRYNAVASLPIVVVGIAVLLRGRHARQVAGLVGATSAVMVGCAAALWAWRRDLLETDNGLEPMILGLQPFIASPTRIDVPAITAWAIAGTLAVGAITLLVRSSRWRSTVVLSTLAVLVVGGSVRTKARIDDTWNPSRSTRAVEELRGDVLTPGTAVDYWLPVGSNSTIPMMLYQFHLPDTEFAVVSDPLDGEAGSLVFAPDDDTELRQAGARIVWRDPNRPIALWRR